MVVEKRRPSLASMGTQAAERTPDGPLRPGRNVRGGGALTCPHLTPAREAAAGEPSRWASGAAGTAVGSGSGMSTVRPERRSAGPTPGLWRGWRVLRQPRYPHRKACFGTMNAERAGSLSHRGVSILWTQVLPEGVSGGRPQG